ncbi:hypothetical protein GCM10010495_75950 [Kitasatospora herbaricolor]|nr:hypothetical protein [Kitasatospora herbaricolor]MDQ0305603.1 hypothetical protein [Kitasatospora herbaricolor]GGV47093.1 hypothetical protein GCM10010495_75950 [Kitasatospora herbaricolor]
MPQSLPLPKDLTPQHEPADARRAPRDAAAAAAAVKEDADA